MTSKAFMKKLQTAATQWDKMPEERKHKIQVVPLDLVRNLLPELEEKSGMEKVKDKLSQYLCNDASEYDSIISKLRNAWRRSPNSLIDHINGIEVWEKVELEFSVKEFCELIGLK